MLLNGVTQAGLGSYLQTSVIAVASLFGPSAVQAMMAGQGAVAVVISSVQTMSAIGAVWSGSTSATAEDTDEDDRAAAKSAFIFFGLSTVFLLACVVLQRWIMGLPVYKEVARSLERAGRKASTRSEERGLMSPNLSDSQVLGHTRETSSGAMFEKGRVLHVAKANIVYEIAVAYVFTVTLVGIFLSLYD